MSPSKTTCALAKFSLLWEMTDAAVVCVLQSCRDTSGGIILKDTHTFGPGHSPPKSNMTFQGLSFHNSSTYWGGKMQAGQALAIQGVHICKVSDVVGTMVPTAGTIQFASEVTFENISIAGKGGFHCGSNVSGVHVVGGNVSPMPKCASGHQ